MKIPLDTLVYRLVRNYLRGTSMRKAALKVSDDKCFVIVCPSLCCSLEEDSFVHKCQIVYSETGQKWC